MGADALIDPYFEARIKKIIMAFYEHTFIARQDISVAQAETLLEHFGKILSDNGGKIVGTEYWGLKTLAYKINKNRKGHYCFMRSDSPADAVAEMERLMRLHDDVMRGLTIKVDAHSDEPTIMMQNKTLRDDKERARSAAGDDAPDGLALGDSEERPRRPRRPREDAPADTPMDTASDTPADTPTDTDAPAPKTTEKATEETGA